MKTIANIIIILLISLLYSCGSGMIGLLEDDMREEKIYMSETYVLQNGCTYFINVENYCEPEFGVVVYSSLEVWKYCPGWDEPLFLEEGYNDLISGSLHDRYLEYIGGE